MLPVLMNVLVVEDDFLLLEMYATLLAGEGYTVERASDGEAGLEAISRGNIDLVLLDLNMPSISGFDVLEHLQQQGGAPPIVVISNTDEASAIKRCKDLGAAEYVVKAQTSLEEIKQLVKRFASSAT